MRDRFGATNPRALQLRFHTQTAGSTLTAQQPDNNIVRVAVQALAAVLGGTQSLHTQRPRRGAGAADRGRRRGIALRTQQIIAHESGVANTVDPVGGSWHVEALTDEIEAGARELLDRIEAMGGTLAAIEAGFIQRQIQDAAYRAQQAIDAGTAVVVGVNRFATEDRPTVDVFALDADVERRQVARAAGRAGGPRRRGAGDASLDAVSAARRGTRQPGAADHRRRRGPRHGGRDCGYAAERVRRVPRSGGRLAHAVRTSC